MGLLGTLFKVVGAVVLVVVGLGAFLYFTDHGAQASVTGRSAGCPPGEIEVTPRLLPMVRHREPLSCDLFSFVCVGYDVTYHVQTQRTIVTEGDRVIYDSQTGEKDTVGLVRCAGSNQGGGLL